MVVPACKQDTNSKVEIVWLDKKAVAIAIPVSVVGDAIDHALGNSLKVYVDTNKTTAILGGYNVEGESLIFKPLVPLSAGLGYYVYLNNNLIGAVKMPLANAADAPRLLKVYPSTDTVPENLLKIYLQFSGPMREGESQKHVALVDNDNDTLHDVFLDLQPELWNKERTVLTVWLDPGRIKRDLVPNRQSGNPLKKGERYTLIVSADWKDVQGLPLKQLYKRQFTVGERDSVSPDIKLWKLTVPAVQTKQPLIASFNEPLDYFLLQESIWILDKNNRKVDGKIQVSEHERKLLFTPNGYWVAGNYRLKVNPILEDLAGNNLIRPFDRDLQVKNPNPERTVFEVSFEVKK